MVRDMHSDDPQQLELLRVCRIGRAQGLKGEVTVQIFTDEPEYRFAPGAVLYTKDGEEEYVVESSRTFKNRWIIKFEGIDDRDASEAANGVVLYGEADDPEEMLEADEWYPKDLISLEARLAEGNTLGLAPGTVVGKVVDVIEVAQWLLKIRLANPVKDADGVVVIPLDQAGAVLERLAAIRIAEAQAIARVEAGADHAAKLMRSADEFARNSQRIDVAFWRQRLGDQRRQRARRRIADRA